MNRLFLTPKQKYYLSAILTGLTAFAVYFCMYAFRKPFTAAKFEGLELFGMDYKIILIISQVLGYATSKFLGIKIISELEKKDRTRWIAGCMGFAGLTLLGFAMTPFPFNFIFMFLNGLPLGLIWGLVFAYLEGRQATEIMAAILSSSFILASGMVKSIGKWLLQAYQLSEFWMPFVTACLFVIPMVFFVFLLKKSPDPTSEDIKFRQVRDPMSKADRKKLFWSMAPGLLVLIMLYMLITAFRDFRDNFSVEVWEELGVVNNSSVFTQSEAPIMVVTLFLFAMFFLIRNNRKAFLGLNLMVMAGLFLIGMVNVLFQMKVIQSPFYWTMLTGIGLYTAYFPFNSMLFERLVAAYKGKANVGFLIYLADSFGYVGSILVLLYKQFFFSGISYLAFFLKMGYGLSLLGLVSFSFTHFYFERKLSSGKNSTTS